MNFLAIIVAAIVAFLIGWIWYGILFKGAWQAATGISDDKAKEGNMPLIFGISFLCYLLISFFMYNFVWHDGDPEFQTFKHGAWHGCFISVFTALPFIANSAVYEQKSFKYIGINWGYWVITLAITGGILNIWR